MDLNGSDYDYEYAYEIRHNYLYSIHSKNVDKYEVRRVPSNWVHPVDGIGKYILLSNYDDDLKQNLIAKCMEDYQNECKDYHLFAKYILHKFEEYLRFRKREKILKAMMPNWPEYQKTHLMMYKTIDGAGYPVSPIFKYDAELAEWLSENYVLADFKKAPFENWMDIIENRRLVPTLVDACGDIQSGVRLIKYDKSFVT